jgi:cyclic pyranopterin monophosphate synthase
MAKPNPGTSQLFPTGAGASASAPEKQRVTADKRRSLGRRRGKREGGSVRHGSRRSLTHVDHKGNVRMVDVGDKPDTVREAIARGSITMSAEALAQIRSGAVKKGDPLQAARLAGIMAAKQTSSLIPLCHPLPIAGVQVDLMPTPRGYDIESRVRTTAQTGVEMEALTAVAVAALTIYDMIKAVDKAMVIGDIRLIKKTGGKSGEYIRRGEI